MRGLSSPWSRLTILILLLAAAGIYAITQGGETLDAAERWVSTLGAVGVPILAVIVALLTAVLFPVTLLAIAAGAIFGPVVGTVIVWSGSVLGAVISFELARAISRDSLQRLVGGRADQMTAFLARRGTLTICFARLVPVVPYWLINYGVALTGLSRRQFFIGTAIGTLPGVGLWVILGDNLTDPSSPAFIISAVLLVGLVVAGAVAVRRTRAQSAGKQAAERPEPVATSPGPNGEPTG